MLSAVVYSSSFLSDDDVNVLVSSAHTLFTLSVRPTKGKEKIEFMKIEERFFLVRFCCARHIH